MTKYDVVEIAACTFRYTDVFIHVLLVHPYGFVQLSVQPVLRRVQFMQFAHVVVAARRKAMLQRQPCNALSTANKGSATWRREHIKESNAGNYSNTRENKTHSTRHIIINNTNKRVRTTIRAAKSHVTWRQDMSNLA